MFKKMIGILGGMGPVASAGTYTELIRLCQQNYQATQDSDFPAVILYSLPMKELSDKGFSDNSAEHHSLVKKLQAGLQKLEVAGAEIIIIDCNTVHYFFTELQNSIQVPIVSLIGTTVVKIVQDQYTRVAVLCSQASKEVALYTQPLAEHGVTVLNTTEEQQNLVNNVILAAMSGTITATHIETINRLIDFFLNQGAECIILGCTEISSISKQLNHQTVLLDSETVALAKTLTIAR